MDRIKKLWGHENIVVNNDLYCMKYLYLKKGYVCSMHYHKVKDETFIVQSGIIKLEHEGKEYILEKDSVFRIKPNEKHRFQSLTDMAVFIEVSTHDDTEDSYRIEKSKKIL